MLALYLMCLIFGGVLVTLSIFAGHIDVDTDFDVHVDVDALAEVEGLGASARLVSFRDLVFFSAFFGLAGTLFTVLGVNFVVTLATSIAIGLAAGLGVHHLMGYLKNSESGHLDDLRHLVGTLAEVVVDIGGPSPGKIAVQSGDRTHQLVARRHDEAERKRFRAKEPVVIVQVENGIAYVAETTFLN